VSKKTAIVTGASSGIGLALTRTLLEQNYRVVATSRRVSQTRELARSPELVLVDGDVGERGTAERVVAAAETNFGGVDLLVNNAGIFSSKPFTEYTATDYAQLLSTNLAGFFHMTQLALGSMAKAKRGHIVNIGTSLSQQPVAGVPCALPILIKGGIEAATRALAIEYGPLGIRVNTLALGIIETPMHPPEQREALRGLSPAARLGTTAEVAHAVLFLESAGFVSGEILRVDGGAHAGKWA
jgi:NAD(P)-dependent dehydrogenase (short-subunit alcohol dehydrogenase family)